METISFGQIWPPHYAKSCVTWMSQNINFVAKDMNPANVHQAHPIENFCGDLAQRYNNAWQAQNEAQLVKRIKKCLLDFDLKDLQSQVTEGGYCKTQKNC